jgi:hypothetical protein
MYGAGKISDPNRLESNTGTRVTLKADRVR